jgi:hypothetical protein
MWTHFHPVQKPADKNAISKATISKIKTKHKIQFKKAGHYKQRECYLNVPHMKAAKELDISVST